MVSVMMAESRSVEDGERGGEAARRVVVEAVQAGLEDGGAVGAHGWRACHARRR